MKNLRHCWQLSAKQVTCPYKLAEVAATAGFV